MSPHPCLPVPRAERQRLTLAAHLALQALLAGEPQDAWLDLPAAAGVATELLAGREVDVDVLRAVERAAAALLDTAGLRTPTAEVKAACIAFVPCFEAILAAVTYRRLIAAQSVTRAASQAHAAAYVGPRACGAGRRLGPAGTPQYKR